MIVARTRGRAAAPTSARARPHDRGRASGVAVAPPRHREPARSAAAAAERRPAPAAVPRPGSRSRTPWRGRGFGVVHPHPRVGLAGRAGRPCPGISGRMAPSSRHTQWRPGTRNRATMSSVLAQLPGMHDVRPSLRRRVGVLTASAGAQLLPPPTSAAGSGRRRGGSLRSSRARRAQRALRPTTDGREDPGRDDPPHPAQVPSSAREVRQVRDGDTSLGGLGEVLHLLLRSSELPSHGPSVSARASRPRVSRDFTVPTAQPSVSATSATGRSAR